MSALAPAGRRRAVVVTRRTELEELLERHATRGQAEFFLRTRVVWINLSRTTNGQPQGVGLAFGDDETGIKCKNYIEDQLPGLVHTDRATYTM